MSCIVCGYEMEHHRSSPAEDMIPDICDKLQKSVADTSLERIANALERIADKLDKNE